MTSLQQVWQDIVDDISALRERPASGKDIVHALLTNRGTHALIVYRLSHFLWGYHVPAVPAILTRLIQILYSTDIAYEAEIGPGCVIFHGMGIVIATYAKIGPDAVIYHGVTVGSRSSSRMGSMTEDGIPTIGAHVFMGAGAKILGKITIGDYAVIGANAVVTTSVPDRHSAIGIPATIKPRETIARVSPDHSV